MRSTLLSLGLTARKLHYDILRLLMPTGYTPVTVNTALGVLKLYTHYEGLQVIDEVFVLGQYSKGLESNSRVVVDVGAHIGTITLLAALAMKRRGVQGVVISVEPVSINYMLLLNNVKLNQLEQYVKPIKAAVASHKTTVEVEWIGNKEKVQTVTMQEIVELIKKLGYDSIDLLKIDIEGAELDVILNNSSWLGRVKRIIMELHPQMYGYSGVSKIVRELKKRGFEVRIVHRLVDTRHALCEWIDKVKSPYTELLTLWKAVVLLYARTLILQYLIAEAKNTRSKR